MNGEASTPFKVTRGVRQGDPMSCLLFDLAIEPLACMIRQSELKGFAIPGLPDRILVSLFADDTTAYLSSDDDFSDLTDILKKWCIASRAKFNEDKTQLIPIGTAEYRASVHSTRRLAPHDEQSQPIPGNMAMVPDGVAVRILGAWLGNDLHENVPKPWADVIVKVNSALSRWRKCKPTLRGKRLIVQMIVGGMTQYLTKVQGMPSHIEDEFVKIIREFIWDGKRSAPIKLDSLFEPISEGGIKLLDIKSRNEAIELTWVQAYLNLSATRPAWAFLADELLSRSILAADAHIAKPNRLNIFLQSWDVNTRRASGLPEDLRTMIKVGRKYKAGLAAARVSDDLRMKLPVWYHIGADAHLRRIGNKITSNCLRDVHDVSTVGDLTKVLQRTRERDCTHHARRNCACRFCVSDRAQGCTNPSQCCRAAATVLADLNPKWHPYKRSHTDGFSLTRRRKDMNKDASIAGDAILFDPSLTEDGDISNLMRVFINPTYDGVEPARRPAQGVIIPQESKTAYTDGSCLENGDLNARAGFGVWFGPNNPANVSARVPGPAQTNQIGEVLAIHAAAVNTPPFAPLHIKSDSRCAIDGLTKHLRRWEDRGWVNVANADAFQLAASALRKRSAPTDMQWVKGHSGDVGNDHADSLAGDGARLPSLELDPNLTSDPRFTPSGVKLTSLTQAIAYSAIRSLNKPLQRTATAFNLDLIRTAAHGSITSRLPTNATIWHALRKKEISRNVSDFMWRATHNSIRVGRYWSHIPGYEERAVCKVCPGDPVEDLKHILLECRAPERRVVWNLCRELWLMRWGTWPELSFGGILGCGLADFSHGNRASPGASRLYRILISESAHLIWCMRCTRKIDRGGEGPPFSSRETTSRWLARVNDRLNMDILMSHTRFGRKALKKHTVLQTWQGTLMDEQNLPEDWSDRTGRLVGIGPPE